MRWMKLYHKDLDVYKKSIEFVIKIYEITKYFPKDETYGLTSQLRRAAISIPSNIAEGCARISDKQVSNFINIALGSLAEIEAQLEISAALGYIKDMNEINENFNSLKSLLLGLKKYVENKLKN